ncbi:unnamed protein product [Lepeophtheirus salmonis]|uniref:(salmon louse) hypothetical protein n=1 Tax=Lepeophtheirus salmonis TaxID=72036 RepID=A0A7R8CZ71_LEPSM|nr:unnamed protein product [Lepeophtheirus salmonis]CAF2973722.1 unnamed protein product [Lepeophtheirus salmonis]
MVSVSSINYPQYILDDDLSIVYAYSDGLPPSDYDSFNKQTEVPTIIEDSTDTESLSGYISSEMQTDLKYKDLETLKPILNCSHDEASVTLVSNTIKQYGHLSSESLSNILLLLIRANTFVIMSVYKCICAATNTRFLLHMMSNVIRIQNDGIGALSYCDFHKHYSTLFMDTIKRLFDHFISIMAYGLLSHARHRLLYC